MPHLLATENGRSMVDKPQHAHIPVQAITKSLQKCWRGLLDIGTSQYLCDPMLREQTLFNEPAVRDVAHQGQAEYSPRCGNCRSRISTGNTLPLFRRLRVST